MAALCMTVGIGAVLVGGKGNMGWVPVNIGLMLAMQWVTIIPHEAGHAFVAHVLGLRVFHISIGVGRRLTSWCVGGIHIDLHLLPLSGFTVCEILRIRWARLQRLCIVAGGPLVNVLLVWGAIEFGKQAWLNESFSKGPAPVFAFIFANCIILLTNLWPYKGSDGAQLLALLFQRKLTIADLHRSVMLYYLELEAQRGDPAIAITQAQAALQDSREAGYKLQLQVLLSVALLNTERFAEARQLLLQLLQDSEHTLEVRAVLHNNLACANLNLEDVMLSDETKALAEQAYRWMPWEPCIRGNLGSVEALFGDAQRALQLLNHKRVYQHSPQLRAAAAGARAVAHARLGNLAASQAELKQAQAADPSSNLLKIARRRLDQTLQG